VSTNGRLPAAGGAVTLLHMHRRVATEGARKRVLAGTAVTVRARRSTGRAGGHTGGRCQEADVLGGRTSASRLPHGRTITVAAADTGVGLEHPDLAADFRLVPDERACDGIDDDANGLADGVRRADLVDGDGDPAGQVRSAATTRSPARPSP
jgi:hypothetical protein